MQHAFAFQCGDLMAWSAALHRMIGTPDIRRRRSPLGQLVKSMLSGRTRDAVSAATYEALIGRYPQPALLAAASAEEIERIIGAVTFAGEKAQYLSRALPMIARERANFDLGFLGPLPLSAALGWLERLPGVGRKVAASTLNASTLARPVFIVDTHVLRVLERLGFVRPKATAQAASEAVTAAMPHWSGDDFLSFHVLVKRLGQTLCRPEDPHCGLCPLAPDCPSARLPRAP